MWQKIKNIYHLGVSVLVNILFLFPSRKIKVIGVTGTDGKTTTVSLIFHILKSSGFKVSYVTSIGAEIAGSKFDTGFHVTTPSSYMLQKFLRKAVNKKEDFFVLEVTSHSIDQNRVWGIAFKVGVITNVTNEHLDYHKTYDNYLKTKEKLLTWSEFAVTNKDDSSYTLLSETKNKKDDMHLITYGLSDSADINPTNFSFKSNLLGDFNKYNILAAVSVCRALGLSDEQIKNGIETFKEPKGRVEFVYDKDFFVMIDFAHTPNAFGSLLSSLRPIVRGRIIHVFGSAGNRDKTKRPFMGEISSKYSDIIILTSEDPRNESISSIMEQIEGGIKDKRAQVIKIPDRKQAIEAAIQMANKEDLVLLTGKAHERSMSMGGREEEWDEFATVKNALKEREKNGL